MAENINLVWALQVDSAILAARLEAFLETRAISSILSICARKEGSPLPDHLPVNVIEMIASAVTDAAYKSRIRDWRIAVVCIRGDCWGLQKEWYEESHGINPEHFDKMDMHGYHKGYPNAIETTIQNVHKRNVGRYLKKIGKFEERKEALMKIFGIYPDFRLLKASRDCNTYWDRDEMGYDIESSRSSNARIPTAFASYLTLPIDDILLQHEKGPNTVSYKVTQMITPSSLQPLERKQKSLFSSAVNTLKLDEAHTNVMVDDKVEDEWPWSDSETDAESAGDAEDIPRSKKGVKKQHVECLECGTALCKGKGALPEKKPKLMLLGHGKLESYDAGY